MPIVVAFGLAPWALMLYELVDVAGTCAAVLIKRRSRSEPGEIVRP